jgi:hypothetical protein
MSLRRSAGISLFLRKKNGFGRGDEATYLGAKGLHPNVFVLWMFHQMAVFEEFPGVLVKDGGCGFV